MDQERLLSTLLASHASIHHSLVIPNDMLGLLFSAMKQLKQASRSNIIYGMCKALAIELNGTAPRMPLERMPIGLLEHTINFFNANSLSQVRITDYAILVIISCRFHSVQRTIVHGYKRCTIYLVRNGTGCTVEPCGPLRLFSNVVMPLVMYMYNHMNRKDILSK